MSTSKQPQQQPPQPHINNNNTIPSTTNNNNTNINNKQGLENNNNNEVLINNNNNTTTSPQRGVSSPQQGYNNYNHNGKRQQGYPNQTPPNQQQPPYQPQHNNNNRPPNQYQPQPNQYQPQPNQYQPQPNQYQQGPPPPTYYQQGPPPPTYYQQGPPQSQSFGPPSPQSVGPQQPPQFQPQPPFVNQPPGIQQPLSPQSSPSSPQNVVIQPNQQNANKKPNLVLKPSPVNHVIPPRTHSAPPSLEEQQQQMQQQMQHQNIKTFTPADKRGPPIQHQSFVMPQQQPPIVQQFNKPMYGVPQQQHQPMYYQPPYFYPQGPVVNQMIPPTTVKKPLDIVNPATNEKVVVDSSPPKSSSTTTSPYTSTTPIPTPNPTPISTSVGIPSPSGNSSTTPSSSPSTGGYVTSFSSGNVNLRKNKQSGDTTPTKDTAVASIPSATSTSTPIKAEFSPTTSEAGDTKSSTATPTETSVSSTPTPEKSAETPVASTAAAVVAPAVEVKPTTTTTTEEVKPTITVDAITTDEKLVETTSSPVAVVETPKPAPVVEEKVATSTPAPTKEEPITTASATATTPAPVANEESSSSSTSSAVKENSTSSTTSSSDASTTNTNTNTPPSSTTTTTTSNSKVEEEEEEWEKKGEEDFNILPSSDLSSSVSSTPATSLAFRNSGEKIVYSKEEMMSLKPKSMEEPTGPLKDLKNQIETNSNQNQLNRSGNKIGGQQQMQQGGKNMGMGPMVQNPNYPPQMNMKYPPQMNMKYPPKNFNQQGQQQGGQQQNYNKYAPGYQYQQQVQQGGQHNQQGGFGQQQQSSYGITFNREPVQQSIAAAPLNEKRWIPTKVNALDDTQKVLRRANFILNKITPEKFEVLTEELLQLNIVEDEKVHRGTIDLIFDKALNESKFCTMYTNLCKKIFEFERGKKEEAKKLVFEKIGVIETENYNRLPPKAKDDFDTENNIKPMFRTLLLSTCQKEYEKIQFESMDKTAPEDLKPEEKTDFEENQFKERKRIFGLFKFIGELFKQQMLSEKIVHGIMVSLIGELQRPSEIKLECFCKLLSIVGKTLKTNDQAGKYLSSYFLRMQQLIDNSPSLSQRIRFLIQNVVDLKNNNWIPKVDESAKTLKEVEATQQNKQEDNRKSTTGVKNTNISNNMFNTAFTFPQSKQPMIPPMYNKNAPTLKQPAQFQAKPSYGGYQQNQQQNQYNNYNNNNNMGGNQYSNNRQQQMGGKNMNMGGGMNNFNNNMNMNNSMNMNNTTTTTNNSPVTSEIQKKWDAVSQSVTESISEFLELKDEEEFVECIKSYVPSADCYPNVISQLISTAVNSQKSENLIKDLIFSLVCEKKFFTQAQFKSGLEIFVAGLPDLFEDRPSAYKSVASVFYSFVVSPQEPSLVTVQQFAQSFAKILDSCGSTISKILYEFVIQFDDPKKAASLFNDNKVGIQGFFTDKDLPKITQSATSYNKDLLPFFESIKL